MKMEEVRAGGGGLGQESGYQSGASVLFLACGMGQEPCRQPDWGWCATAKADGNTGSSLGHSLRDT